MFFLLLTSLNPMMYLIQRKLHLKKSKGLSIKVQFHTLIFSGIFLLSRWSPQDQSTLFQFQV